MANPFAAQPARRCRCRPGESTRKGDTLFLHIFDWPTNGQLVVGGLKSNVKNYAYLLANLFPNKNMMGGYGVSAPAFVHRLNALDVSIAVPKIAPDKADSVVVYNCDGGIQTDTNRLLQPEFPSDTLRAFDGELAGGLHYGPGKKTDDYVLNWTKPDQSVIWPVRLDEPATYEVFVNYDATEDSAGGTFVVSFGSQTLGGTVSANRNQSIFLGRVALMPGNFPITVTATKINGDELFRLRDLELKPVAN